jgi:hypothetical protein
MTEHRLLGFKSGLFDLNGEANRVRKRHNKGDHRR